MLFWLICLRGFRRSSPKLSALALTFHKSGSPDDIQKAEGWLELCEKLFGVRNAFFTGDAIVALADLYRRAGRYAEAEDLLKRALPMREKLFGKDEYRVGDCLNYLATVYHAQGKEAEAEPLYQRSLAIYEKALGSNHSYTATALYCLAELYSHQKRYAEAEPFYKRAITSMEQSNHPDLPEALGNYAALLKETGKTSEAFSLELKAKEIRSKRED